MEGGSGSRIVCPMTVAKVLPMDRRDGSGSGAAFIRDQREYCSRVPSFRHVGKMRTRCLLLARLRLSCSCPSSTDVGWLSFANAGRELSSEVLVESLSVPFGSLGADEPSGASFLNGRGVGGCRRAVIVRWDARLVRTGITRRGCAAGCFLCIPLVRGAGGCNSEDFRELPVICGGGGNIPKEKTLLDARAESIERGTDVPTRPELGPQRAPNLCVRAPTDN